MKQALIITSVFLFSIFTIGCSSVNQKADGSVLQADSVSWLDVDSFHRAYDNYFDYSGFACEYGIICKQIRPLRCPALLQ